MGKIKSFICVFLILLIFGLVVGAEDDYSLRNIIEGVLVLFPFCLLSSLAVVAKLGADEEVF